MLIAKKKLSFCWWAIFPIFLISLLFGASSVQAATPNSSFSATPLYGGLPIQKNKEYFALTAKPNRTYKLPILLKNNGNQPIKINLAVNNAETSQNGIITYGDSKVLMNDKTSVANCVQGSRFQSVVLKPQKSETVSFKVKTPKHLIGLQLGGINVSAVPVQQNTHISNVINYIIGVSLSDSQGSRTRLNKLSMGKIGEKELGSNGLFTVNVKNKKTQLIRDARADVTVYHYGIKVAAHHFPNVSIAPQSETALMVPHKKLDSGTYEFKVKINTGGQTVNLSRYYNPYPIPRIKASHFPLFVVWLLTIEVEVIYLLMRVWWINKHRGHINE